MNATRQGFEDPRTRLLFQMLRVFSDVVKEKHKLQYSSENVASMTEADKSEFTRLLRVVPLRICSSGLCQSRRARYFWPSWAVPTW